MKGSPFQRNFGIGVKEAPEKESPFNSLIRKLKSKKVNKETDDGADTIPGETSPGSPFSRRSYNERQRAKAKKLYARAERREAKTAIKRESLAGMGRKWEGVEPIFGTGKYARRRAEKAELKAAAGSRKDYRQAKRFLRKGNIKSELFGRSFLINKH